MDIFTGEIIDFVESDGQYSPTSEPTYHINGNDLIKESPYVVQQYTGLKDKNGKEIYEGDILTYYNKYSDKIYTQIVKWDQMWAGFGLFEKDNKWCKESDWVKIANIEIIGNIYENPELL